MGHRHPAPPAHGVAAAAFLVLVAVLLSLGAQDAEASHLRGGTLSWEIEEALPGVGWTVNFTGSLYYRMGWAGGIYGPGASLGDVGCLPSTDNGMQELKTGDGNVVQFCEHVVHVSPASDWLMVEFIDPVLWLTQGIIRPGVHHTYTIGGTYQAHWGLASPAEGTCCRLEAGNGHVNNANLRMQMTMELTLPTLPIPGLGAPNAHGPRAFVPPVVGCQPNAVCHIPLPAYDGDGDPLTYRWATAPEPIGATGTFTQPGPPYAPNAAVLDVANQRVEWDTTGAHMSLMCRTYYSIQVMIEDQPADPAYGGFVPVDWFINICNQDPPFWVQPPTPCGQTLDFMAGQANSYTVEAAHPLPATPVTVFTSPQPQFSVPGGALQALPVTGNPATSTLTWNPPMGLVGTTRTVHYYAHSGDMYAPVCEIAIHVVGPPPTADFHCRSLGAPYLRVEFTDQSTTAPDTQIVSWEWDLGDGTTGTNTSAPAPFIHTYPAVGDYTVTLTVHNDVMGSHSITRTCHAPFNHPPALDPLMNKAVYEEHRLDFLVTGHDPENDPTLITWNRGPLPSQARLDVLSGTTARFEWTPTAGQAGVYGPILFRIHEQTADGRTDQQSILITVLPLTTASAPGGSDVSGDGVPDHLSGCPHGGCPGPGGPGASGTDGPGDAAQSGPAGEDSGTGMLQDAAEDQGAGTDDPGGADSDGGPAAPCGPTEASPRSVHARPGPNGEVTVAWDFAADCALDAFRVWRGEGGSDLVGTVPFHAGTDGDGVFSIPDPTPFTDRAYRYTVEALPPGAVDVHNPLRTALSNVVDLRECNGLDRDAQASCLAGLADRMERGEQGDDRDDGGPGPDGMARGSASVPAWAKGMAWMLSAAAVAGAAVLGAALLLRRRRQRS